MPMRHNDWKQIEIVIEPTILTRIAGDVAESIYLKSSIGGGRYDIFSSQPRSVVRMDKAELGQAHNIKNVARLLHQSVVIDPDLIPVPFASGLMGYVSYEATAFMLGIPTKTIAGSYLPAIFIGYFTWSYVYDHWLKQGLITFSPDCPEMTRTKVLAMMQDPAQTSDAPHSLKLPEWQRTISFDDYAESFKRAKDYIEAGDVYQINLAQMFTAKSLGNPARLFEHLSKQIQTNYSALINPGRDSSILSFSPEQFIAVNGKSIVTRPIKGTLRNSGNCAEVEALSRSEKNRAENVMIVDLMRNDLGRVCKNFSISVPSLCKVETLKNVHHLVSTIEGELHDDCDALDAFFTSLPGGSITGAPKLRAMEIIDELENSGRDAYCGSVFYYSGTGNFDSNILIRTIVQSGDQLFCWGGGGIVIDSVLEEEYAESLIKVQNLTGISDPF